MFNIYIYIYFENCAGYEMTWEKHCTAGKATSDNIEHAHCMLDT